jgi:glycosyltransferase involved in cell wall biosynthesis
MCKKIVIDATGGQTYGSKFHIKSFVEYFSNHNKSDELIIYLKDDYLSIKQKNIKIIIVPSAKIKFIRILFSAFILPILCLFKNYNTIYYPFDVGSFIPIKTRIILGIKNPNLILPKELITLKFSGIHKLVSKISSFFANILLFPSKTALNQISTHLFDVKHKEFIYHGLDFSDWVTNPINKLENKAEHKYIFYCSNLYKFKNVEVLIHALDKINKFSNNKYKLVVCGDFVDLSYKTKIFNIIKKYKLNSYVKFYNNLSRNKIVNLYSNAELIVIPTKFETFGHMFLESLYSKRPVIVAKTEIAIEIVKDSVLYFDANDFEQLSNIIINKEYLNSHNVRLEKGIQIVNNFSINSECSNLYKLILS